VLHDPECAPAAGIQSASKRRLGNAHDLVGRYFMEHLEMPGGELVLAKPQSTRTKMYAFDFGTTKARGELALSAQVQKEHGILNGTASVEGGEFGGSGAQHIPVLRYHLVGGDEGVEQGWKERSTARSGEVRSDSSPASPRAAILPPRDQAGTGSQP